MDLAFLDAPPVANEYSMGFAPTCKHDWSPFLGRDVVARRCFRFPYHVLLEPSDFGFRELVYDGSVTHLQKLRRVFEQTETFDCSIGKKH